MPAIDAQMVHLLIGKAVRASEDPNVERIVVCAICWASSLYQQRPILSVKPILVNDVGNICPYCRKPWIEILIQWSSNTQRWMHIRPRPADVRGRFAICADYIKCRPCKVPVCKFAHSIEELQDWEIERKQIELLAIVRKKKKIGGVLLDPIVDTIRMKQTAAGVYQRGYKYQYTHDAVHRSTLSILDPEACEFTHDKLNQTDLDKLENSNVSHILDCLSSVPTSMYRLLNEIDALDIENSKGGVFIALEGKWDLEVKNVPPLPSPKITWKFRIESQHTPRTLVHAVLLYPNRPQFGIFPFRGSRVQELHTGNMSLAPHGTYKWLSCNIQIHPDKQPLYISVTFVGETTGEKGEFRQWFILDFGSFQYGRELVVNIRDEVDFMKLSIPPQDNKSCDNSLNDHGLNKCVQVPYFSPLHSVTSSTTDKNTTTTNGQRQQTGRIHRRNRIVFIERVCDILKLPMFPVDSEIIESEISDGAFKHTNAEVNQSGFLLRMHNMLALEEVELRKALANRSLVGVQMSFRFGSLNPLAGTHENSVTAGNWPGELCVLNTSHLKGDDIVSPLRAGDVAIVQRTDDDKNMPSFKATIFQMTTEAIVLCLEEAAHFEFGQNGIANVTFSSSRHLFRFMHSAVDKVSLNCLFPSPFLNVPNETSIESNSEVELTKESCFFCDLNSSQIRAINSIIHFSCTTPIIIVGPHGSGRTIILAETIRQLMLGQQKKGRNRILYVTSSDTAADHFLYQYVKPLHHITTLRVYMPNKDPETIMPSIRQFCLIKNTNRDLSSESSLGSFVPSMHFLDIPNNTDIMSYDVVIATYESAGLVASVSPQGLFSHILLDDASVVTQAESIIPMSLAGSTTVMALTGDHNDIKPRVWSSTARRLNFDESMLERYYNMYRRNTGSFQLQHMILLSVNYVIHSDVLSLPSKMFYSNNLTSGNLFKEDIGYWNVLDKLDNGDQEIIFPLLNDNSNNMRSNVHFYNVPNGMEKDIKNCDGNICSFVNCIEATLLVDLVESCLTTVTLDVTSPCILVFAAYDAQVIELRRLLVRQIKSNQVAVAHIREVITITEEIRHKVPVFVSLVRTSNTTLSTDAEIAGGGLSLLGNSRLFSALFFSARSHLVIIGNSKTALRVGTNNLYWREVIDSCERAGTFNEYYVCSSKQHDIYSNSPITYSQQQISEQSRFRSTSMPTDMSNHLEDKISSWYDHYDNRESSIESRELQLMSPTERIYSPQIFGSKRRSSVKGDISYEGFIASNNFSQSLHSGSEYDWSPYITKSSHEGSYNHYEANDDNNEIPLMTGNSESFFTFSLPSHSDHILNKSQDDSAELYQQYQNQQRHQQEDKDTKFSNQNNGRRLSLFESLLDEITPKL